MRGKLIYLASLVFLGALALPVLVYYTGTKLVGPYEGTGGFPQFLGSVYLDAIRGHPGAWLLLLAPALLFAVWRGYRWLHRRRQSGQ